MMTIDDNPLFQELNAEEAALVRGGLVINVPGFFGVFDIPSANQRSVSPDLPTVVTTDFSLVDGVITFPTGSISLF